MMNKIFKLVVIAAGLAAAVSCQKYSVGKLISVRVTANDTKSVVTTTSSLVSSGKFVMAAYLDDPAEDSEGNAVDQAYIVPGTNNSANVTMSSGSWHIAGTPKWVAGTVTRFWCWHPESVTSRVITLPEADAKASSIAFTYQTPDADPDHKTDADNSKDLLFSYAARTYSKGSPIVDITFHHALAQVNFCVSTNDGSFDKNLVIKNITISGIKSYGEASFTGDGNGSGAFTWANQDGAVTYGQDYDAVFTGSTVESWTASTYTKDGSKYNLYTCDNAFYLIPQTLTDDAMISVTFSDGVNPDMTVTRPLGKDTVWSADKYYSYKIGATTLGREIKLSVTLADWSDRDDKIII